MADYSFLFEVLALALQTYGDVQLQQVIVG